MPSLIDLIENGKSPNDIAMAIQAGANIDEQDEFGNTALFLSDDEGVRAFLHTCYPSSLNWTEEQKTTRLQSMYLLHACGLSLQLLPDQPDPEAWGEKYKKLNTVSIKDEASHARDMLVTMARQFMIAPLLNRYPSIESFLCVKEQRRYIEQQLANALGRGLVGPNKAEKVPMIALPKILEMTNRWDRNRHEIDKGVEEFRLFSIDTAIGQPIQAPNKLWIIPFKSYDDLKYEGDVLTHCLWGHRVVCMFDGLNVYGVRSNPGEPAYTAGFIPAQDEKHYREYSEPLGLKNAAAPPEVKEAWDWFQHEVNAGRWGKPKELIRFAKNKSEMREQSVDVLRVIAGYNPRGASGIQEACSTWELWARKMDDLLRYRKQPLDHMLSKTEIYSAYDRLAQDYSLNQSRQRKQLVLF